MDLKQIIEESVNKVLEEMDLVPTDRNGEVNLVKRRSVNAWKMIYKLMDNVNMSMETTFRDKKGSVTNKDVDNIIDYIYNSLQNITKNAL
jgi:hypothetical protein